jgi:5-methyltetrahydrofolate--homocysteine methyltransferase
MASISDLGKHIEAGAFKEVENLVHTLLDEGVAPNQIIEESIVPTLDVVGQKFSKGECFIPEMLIAAKSAQKALEILRPKLVGTDYKPRGKVVIGTVMGDLHDIGKNIVSMVLQSGGFEVKDLGADVSPETFVDTIKDYQPDVVALSCLLTTTMPSMRRTIEKINEAGVRANIKIIIGGPPINDSFASEIGADIYGKDAYVGLQSLRQAIPA